MMYENVYHYIWEELEKATIQVVVKEIKEIETLKHIPCFLEIRYMLLLLIREVKQYEASVTTTYNKSLRPRRRGNRSNAKDIPGTATSYEVRT